MKKNMQENFDMLEKRISDMIHTTDLKKIREELSKIKGATICTGVGGSSVVSEFASKVLSEKNRIIAVNRTPRDLVYLSLKGFNNVLACSYSGSNYGVEVSFKNNLNKYLLTNNGDKIENVTSLQYKNTLEKEKSFISLASTLVPMSVLLNYYLYDFDWYMSDNHFLDWVYEYDFSKVVDDSDCYEIISGYDTSTAAKFLESTMVESGIAIPIVHDKYDYCHGRTTTSYHCNNSLIYYNSSSELDNLILNEAGKYYKNVIVLDKISGGILGEYILTLQSMYLAKAIAEKKGIDLSGVDYSPLCEKVYKYHGKM
jgi:hypothetical protein